MFWLRCFDVLSKSFRWINTNVINKFNNKLIFSVYFVD